MAIETVKDPISGKEMTLAKGTVHGVYLNELKNVKTFSGQNGDWTPDKSMKVKIDNDFIQLGLTDKDSIRCKDTSGNYHDLQRGMQVTAVVDVKKNGNYTNYDSKTSRITINDTTVAQQPNTNSNSSGGGVNFQKRNKDETGMRAGHSINGAFNLTRNKMVDVEEFLEIAKHVDNVTEAVKTIYAEKTGLKRDSYDLGACVGNAVLNACKLVTVAKKDTLEEKTLGFLNAVAEPLLAHIRGEGKKEEAPQDPEGTCTPDVNQEPISDSFEDDIPFN